MIVTEKEEKANVKNVAYEVPKIDVTYLDEQDVVRTSLLPDQSGVETGDGWGDW